MNIKMTGRDRRLVVIRNKQGFPKLLKNGGHYEHHRENPPHGVRTGDCVRIDKHGFGTRQRVGVLKTARWDGRYEAEFRNGTIDAKNRNGRDFLCMDCAHVDDADENAACNIRQRTIEILTLRTAGHSPTKALNLLRKDILANANRYAKNAKNTRTRNAVAREGENQPSGGQRPTHHAAGRVPHRSAIAGEKRQTGPQAGLLSNAQHPEQQRHKNSITSV